jgi:hypothetical protein
VSNHICTSRYIAFYHLHNKNFDDRYSRKQIRISGHKISTRAILNRWITNYTKRRMDVYKGLPARVLKIRRRKMIPILNLLRKTFHIKHHTGTTAYSSTFTVYIHRIRVVAQCACAYRSLKFLVTTSADVQCFVLAM